MRKELEGEGGKRRPVGESRKYGVESGGERRKVKEGGRRVEVIRQMEMKRHYKARKVRREGGREESRGKGKRERQEETR